jgi:hypothetical protein
MICRICQFPVGYPSAYRELSFARLGRRACPSLLSYHSLGSPLRWSKRGSWSADDIRPRKQPEALELLQPVWTPSHYLERGLREGMSSVSTVPTFLVREPESLEPGPPLSLTSAWGLLFRDGRPGSSTSCAPFPQPGARGDTDRAVRGGGRRVCRRSKWVAI